MASSGQRKLTNAVRVFLGIAWIGGLIGAVFIPLAAIALNAGLTDQADRVSAGFFAGFKLFAAPGSADLLMHGHSDIELALADGSISFLAFLAGEIGILVFLYGVWHLRKIIAALSRGETFSFELANRIRTVGVIILVWQVLKPVLQYVTSSVILADANPGYPGLELYPAFEISAGGIFVGLSVVLLSGILKEAADLQEDQSLTI